MSNRYQALRVLAMLAVRVMISLLRKDRKMVESPRKNVDLSHVIESGTKTYKGLPAPVICDFLSREASKALYDAGTEFHIAKIEMVANTGTYMDCPFHRYADGKGFHEISIEASTDLPALKLTSTQREIGPELFRNADLKGKAVLVETGWSRHWGSETYFENHPFINEAAAIFLRDAGVKLVGIDSHNIDNTTTKSRPVHTTLLGAGILIVEHLCNLQELPHSGFNFTALPPKIKGIGTFPVRAFARLL
jgi:arylformamidase